MSKCDTESSRGIKWYTCTVNIVEHNRGIGPNDVISCGLIYYAVSHAVTNFLTHELPAFDTSDAVASNELELERSPALAFQEISCTVRRGSYSQLNTYLCPPWV